MADNTSHAKKMFYDYLDRERPWNHYPNNAYALMEDLVAHAALYFAGERVYNETQWNEQQQVILRLTESLVDHPEFIGDVNCMCAECRSNA